MSMRILKLTTYWSAEEAHDVLTFLDELRDQLLGAYEEDIIRMRTAEVDQEAQQQLPLENGEPF